jgi:hypothetical protein
MFIFRKTVLNVQFCTICLSYIYVSSPAVLLYIKRLDYSRLACSTELSPGRFSVVPWWRCLFAAVLRTVNVRLSPVRGSYLFLWPLVQRVWVHCGINLWRARTATCVCVRVCACVRERERERERGRAREVMQLLIRPQRSRRVSGSFVMKTTSRRALPLFIYVTICMTVLWPRSWPYGQLALPIKKGRVRELVCSLDFSFERCMMCGGYLRVGTCTVCCPKVTAAATSVICGVI